MFVVLDDLGAAVDALAEADPHALACEEVLVELRRVRERLAAVDARLTAAFDAASGWAPSGARNMAAWLAARCRLPKGDAQRQVRLGRALRHMPLVEAAWLAGDIGEAQVQTLNRSRQPSVADAFARDEADLVAHAKSASFRSLQRRLCYWRQTNQPDDEEDRAAAQRADRRLHVSQSFEDAWFLDGVLDPIGGSIVADELRRLEQQLFQADWAAARARLGREPTIDELERTAPQRRADALVEMAKRSATAPAGGRKPRPLFTVLVGYETFAGRICELANGTVVTPGSLVPWLTDAEVERVVFGPDRRVIEVGRRVRFFRGALRRGVQARDRECFHPLCEEPIEQIDHTIPYAAGGETTQDNGRGACGFHNRQRHHRPRRDKPTTANAAGDDDPPRPHHHTGAGTDANGATDAVHATPELDASGTTELDDPGQSRVEPPSDER